MDMIMVIIRSFASLMALFFLTKLLGRKQVSQLSMFDYVIGISMGSIAAEMTVIKNTSFSDGLIAMTTYAIIAYVISFITLKSNKFRYIFSGTPIILIQDGKLIRKNLKKSLLDINDLLQEARSNGYFTINEIGYAIMEACGKISFLPKTENRSVTLKDLKLKDRDAFLHANVIIDGIIMDNNLKTIKKDKKWLLKEIKKQGYNNPHQIIYATVDNNYNLTIYDNADNLDSKNVLL